MKITKAKPQGYCKGVAKALQITLQALEDSNIPKPIYSLGMVIHNKRINAALEEKGLIVLKGDKLLALKGIKTGSVLFSAHGVSPLFYDIANEKGLTIIDTTCKDVLLVHNKIKEALKNNKKVYYLGTPTHAECEGVLGISDKIALLDGKIEVAPDSFIACQTTLSYDDILNASKKYNIPLEAFDFRCKATTERQKALKERYDLTLVVGDKLSNNTQKLLAIAKSYNQAYLIEDLSELDPNWLKGVKTLLITAGASTPAVIVDEIIAYIESNTQTKPVSKLTNSHLL